MRKAVLLFAVALFNGLLETSHATTCTATTEETCKKTSFMTGTCSSGVCKCLSGYEAGHYGCQVKQKATIYADFTEVVTGGDIELTCGPVGSTDGYKWYKDGAEIVSEAAQEYTTTTDDAATDGGAFTCTSTVAGLVTEKSDELAVSVVDSATTQPEVTGMPAKLTEGMVVTFTCVGGPKNAADEYKWFNKDGPIADKTSATYKHTVVTTDNVNTIKCERSDSDSASINFPNPLSTNVEGAEVKAVSSLNLIAGETLTLDCQLTGGFPLGDQSAITYAWIKDDTSISSNGDSFSYTKTSATSDSGAYKCSVQFGAQAAIESAAMTVAVKETLAKGSIVPSISEPLIGGYFSLTCNIKSLTTVDLTYTWSKGSTLLGVTDQVLQFNEATVDDNGEYICTATADDLTVTNDPDTVAADAVSAKTPVVTVSPTNAGIGDKLTFTCGDGDVGSPGMTYKWSVGSDVQSGKTSDTFEYTPESSDQVTIKCNYVFDSTSSADGDKSITPKYIFGVALQVADATVTTLKPVAASKVKVSCAVSKSAGAGACTYQWNKDTSDVDGATSEVYEITAGTAGSSAEVYKCTATCKPDDTPVASGDLTVTPQATAEKPTILAIPGTSPVVLGELVLTCVSDSYAEGATFVWKKDSVAVSGKTGMTLKFEEVLKDNDGAYVCEITVGGQTSDPSDATNIATQANEVSCVYPQDCDGDNFDSTTCNDGKCKCVAGHELKGGLCTSSGSGMVMASLMVIVSALLAQKFF